jgi:hypothetical protein
MPFSSPAYGRVRPPSTDPKSSRVSRAPWKSASRLWQNWRRCRQVALYGRCPPSSVVSLSGCESNLYEWGRLGGAGCGLGQPVLNALYPLPVLPPSLSHFSSSLLLFRDYYAALLRTHQSFVAPTQGKLLNYVQRVALGVVAQITVRPLPGEGHLMAVSYLSLKLAF